MQSTDRAPRPGAAPDRGKGTCKEQVLRKKRQMTDLTRRAIERQLKAMGLEEFELTVTIPKDVRISTDTDAETPAEVEVVSARKVRSTVETVTPGQIIEAMPRLKRANQTGYSIYVRGPRDRDHDLILVDDLKRLATKAMENDGLKPAAITETSPGSFQAWLRFGEPLPADLRREVANILAARYGGDPGGADAHQSGRLAGFTNQKPKHRTEAGAPFVLLHTFAGHVVKAGRELIDAAQIALAQRVEVVARQIELIPAPEADSDLVRWWRAGQAAIPTGKSLSEVDWFLTHLALGVGRTPEDVAAALEVVSDRKGRHASEYARQTVTKAAGIRLQHDDLPSPS